MKKLIVSVLTLLLMGSASLSAQGLLKKVTNAMKDEILGTKKVNAEPEPACACDNAETVVSLGGDLKLIYEETRINVALDGSLLLSDPIKTNNYIVKDGNTSGPYAGDDPRLAPYKDGESNEDGKDFLIRKYKDYISKSGEKYLITFAGKTYGPYAVINDFVIPYSNDKFAALVTENVAVTESEGQSMEKAIENAKTDQEKMELAMKYSQQMAQKVMQGGGASSLTAKIISSVPNASYDMVQQGGASLNGTAKFDDIILISHDRVYNVQGKQVMTLKPEHAGVRNIFVNSANTKYALYNYGTLTFSDGTPMINDIVHAREAKIDGTVYIVYMYYSPKNNAIMQCKIQW